MDCCAHRVRSHRLNFDTFFRTLKIFSLSIHFLIAMRLALREIERISTKKYLLSVIMTSIHEIKSKNIQHGLNSYKFSVISLYKSKHCAWRRIEVEMWYIKTIPLWISLDWLKYKSTFYREQHQKCHRNFFTVNADTCEGGKGYWTCLLPKNIPF